MINKKVILIVRDGWGFSTDKFGNAIMAAKTPNSDNYIQNYPTSLLKCIGEEVGNPESAQGGSEVGHLTLGAGRVVWQPQESINRSIDDGSFFNNPALIGAIENCKKNNSSLHLSGLGASLQQGNINCLVSASGGDNIRPQWTRNTAGGGLRTLTIDTRSLTIYGIKN